MKTAFIEAESIEAEARRILEELIRLDELSGTDPDSAPHTPK